MPSEHEPFDADDSLDATLREFFDGALAGQVGRAQREFESHLRSEAKSGGRQRTLLILAFTGSMAATIAGLWASPLLRTITPTKHEIVKNDAPPTAPTIPVVDVVEHLSASRTIDEGIMMLQDTPVRVYRKHALEQTNVLDENDHVTSQETTPSDTLVFVKMNTY